MSDDLRNLVALQCAAARLFDTTEHSDELDALLADVERRAQSLVGRARYVRDKLLEGPQEGAPPIVVVQARNVVGVAEEAGPLTGAKVRDVMMRYASFTISELMAELDCTRAQLKKFMQPMMLAGTVREAGKAFGKQSYEFVPPEPAQINRETRVPPERDRPAYEEARATGMPVRITTERADRRGRSTPGQRQKIINRDRNYERMESAKRQRAEAQRVKAQKDPKWKSRKKRAA